LNESQPIRVALTSQPGAAASLDADVLHRDIRGGPLGACSRLCYRLAELMAEQSTGCDVDIAR